MRRKDREVTDSVRIQNIIDRCSVCRVGFNDNGQVYIVPLNFGYTKTADHYTLYFHGAKEGRKIDLIRQNPEVGFEMDTGYQLTDADRACSFSVRYQSIIGNGRISLIEDPKEKAAGLNRVMYQSTGKDDWEFDERMLSATAIFKIEVTNLSCKEHE